MSEINISPSALDILDEALSEAVLQHSDPLRRRAAEYERDFVQLILKSMRQGPVRGGDGRESLAAATIGLAGAVGLLVALSKEEGATLLSTMQTMTHSDAIKYRTLLALLIPGYAPTVARERKP